LREYGDDVFGVGFFGRVVEFLYDRVKGGNKG
jgi:hypothetical protein